MWLGKINSLQAGEVNPPAIAKESRPGNDQDAILNAPQYFKFKSKDHIIIFRNLTCH